MKNRILLFCAVLIVASFASCIKGDTGAPGPQGPTGTANLSNGTLYNSAWTYNSSYNDFEFSISYPDITQYILDHGAILAYYRPAGYNVWFAVPDQSVSVTLSVGFVDYFCNNNPGLSDFKVVVIAPDAMHGHTKEQLRNLTLTQLQQLLGGKLN